MTHVVENVKGAPKARHTIDVMKRILAKYGRNASAEGANGRRVGVSVAWSVHFGLLCQGCKSVDLEVIGDALRLAATFVLFPEMSTDAQRTRHLHH